MKRKIIFITMALVFSLISIPFSQNQLPREYINPEELVSFNSDIELDTALELLSEYSIQFSQKPIYDPQKNTEPIGIDIRSYPWKKALGLILSRRGLWYVEKPRYFEIVDATQGDSNITGGSVIEFSKDISLKPNSREVKIETIFFEGDRKALTEIGLDWSTFSNGKVKIDAKQAGALQLKDDIFSIKAGIGRNLIGVDVEVLLKAFDSQKIGKVLSQPQVIVTEGKEGHIQVGQDFSIKERDFAGNLIDRFYSTGTILRVTPFIFKNNDDKNQNKKTIIFLKLHVERSTVHPDVVSTIINKSEANSFIQLYNGEETLIAGLYSTEKNVLRKGIPILKDLPWWFLGFPYIFGYNSIEKVEKELVIIIKATLLKNVHDREKISSSEVLNLKKSLVDGSDIKFRSQPSNQQQLVMNTNKKIQATNISVLADDSNGKNKPELHPAKQVNKNLKEPTSSNFTFGKIKKIKNKLALIEWFKMCEADKLFGKQLPVVRKDDTKQKVEFVGIVQIIETRNNCSVGKKIRNNKKFKIGDYLVIQQ